MIFKQLFILTISLYIFTGCQNEAASQIEKTDQISKIIVVKKSNLFKDYSNEKNKIADFIADYLNIMHDSTLDARNFYWSSTILTVYQDKFLHGGFEKNFLIHNPPKILGIRDLGERNYLAKIAFEQDSFIFKIMNLKIGFDGLDRPYFIDLLSENLAEYESSTKGKVTFLYSPKTTKNDSLEQEMASFNLKTAILFQIPPKSVKLIACKDLEDYCNLLGYDYMPYLNYDTQTGGIAMPQENILICANNSPYYPHELVHLYTSDLNSHTWFDEGISTYLGGSVEYSLDYHLKKLANLKESLNFSEIPENKTIDDDTNVKYSIGGLFCKLAFENKGREGLMKLLNSGKTEEDFHKALYDVFGLEKKNYNHFIKNELKAFETN